MGKTTDPIVRSFSLLIQKNFSVCKIILFGSQVNGKKEKRQ